MSTPRSRGNEAAAVSRHLRSLDIRPLPSGTPRDREGVRVQAAIFDAATVSVDLDDYLDAAILAGRITTLVQEAGVYAVRANALNPAILTFTRKDAV